ncbi:MAG TPA: peptidylprolyl isomerase [Flavisolibacter sp.]|nr:peptidylprolyl isomerase [Flavisolibacter sp.]
MKKLLTAVCLAATFSAPAQTLFTYGKDKVSATDFLEAFQKNNQGPVTEKVLKNYLDLYIASRLKIREAKAKGYDTLPQLLADLANLRQQILPTYLNDKESMNRMIGEAFSRSQKDLHLAHIFIKAGNNDAAAEQKKEAVLQALGKRGFAEVAKEFSDDPSAKTNGGDLGWITVFSLPYELENLAYSTPAGAVSAVYKSKAGYHILKNLGERKALGRIRAAQILLALPPNSSDATKKEIQQRADSLYNRLQQGDDFGKLATAFSNDVISAASNGQMTEFGVGDFEPLFESTVLGLPKDGDISKPFVTAHGYHIVKRLKLSPVSARLDEETRENLRKRIEQSDRAQFAKAALAQKIMKQAGFQKAGVSDAELWAYSDSVLKYQVPKTRISLQPTTPLLKIGNQKLSVSDWTTYAQMHLYKPDGSGARPYTQLWDDFVQTTALNYYQDHLENFNEEFRRQSTEFAEGNLFFEIMQRQVWTPAQTDSAALAAYYQKHKAAYNWKESADAVLFYAANEQAAKEFYSAVAKKPADWRTVLNNYAEQITADSNRFEISQLPRQENASVAEGTLTSPVINKADNTASFAYVMHLHKGTEPRNFADAKGLVINDYQTQLEKQWLERLKKKYPVSVNQKVWSDVVRKASNK